MGILVDQVVLLVGSVVLWSRGAGEGTVTKMEALVCLKFIFWGPVRSPGMLGIVVVCTWVGIT